MAARTHAPRWSASACTRLWYPEPSHFSWCADGDGVQNGESRRAAQHLLGQHRVKLDPVELGARERPGLVPDGVRHDRRSEVVHERRAAHRGDVVIGEPQHTGGIGRELGAATAVPAHVRRLEVDEVGGDSQGVVEFLAGQHAARLGLESEDGVPRVGLGELIEPGASVLDEQVGERRVVRAVASIPGGLDRVVRREQAADRLHVVAQVHHAHREWDRLPLRVIGIAVSVPALEREAQRFTHVGTEVEPLHEHVGDLAPRREVVDRPLARRLLDHLDDLVSLLRAATGRREGHDVSHHLLRIRGVVHERLGADRDLVAEDGRDFMGVAGAPDVAKQRHPVDGLAQVFVERGGLTD